MSPRGSGRKRRRRFSAQRCGDPGTTLLCLEGGENPHLAGEQETQRVYRLTHPGGIGHHRDSFPLRQMVDRNVEVAPPGAGKTRPYLVIQPHLAVALQRPFHRRAQDVVAFLVGDATARDDADHVVGKVPDQLNHSSNPCSSYFAADTRRLVPTGALPAPL